jgi:glycosyltransferase involved in cell wall biosynthesis
MQDFEFIIIDDGSSDGSTDVLKSYAARDPRIRLSIQENCGLTKALNVGLKLSRGELVREWMQTTSRALRGPRSSYGPWRTTRRLPSRKRT